MVGEGQFGLRYKGMECQPPEEDRMWQTGEYGTLRRLEWPQLTSWGWHPVWGLTFWINKLLCTRVTLWVLIELTSEGPALNWSYSHKTKQNKMAVILFYFYFRKKKISWRIKTKWIKQTQICILPPFFYQHTETPPPYPCLPCPELAHLLLNLSPHHYLSHILPTPPSRGRKRERSLGETSHPLSSQQAQSWWNLLVCGNKHNSKGKSHAWVSKAEIQNFW